MVILMNKMLLNLKDFAVRSYGDECWNDLNFQDTGHRQVIYKLVQDKCIKNKAQLGQS